MGASKVRKGSQTTPARVLTTAILALALGAVDGAGAAQAQEPEVRASGGPGYGYVVSQSGRSGSVEAAQVPQDIRIMQRIVRTALGEVEAPELPEELRRESGAAAPPAAVNFAGSEARLWTIVGAGNRVYSIGSRDVTGFYMQGYGYLFTVKWRVRARGLLMATSGERVAELGVLVSEARRAAASGEAAEARAAGEAERALQEERERAEAQQLAWERWSNEYRELLANALRDVVAVYGSTLKRATPDESITFIADFGGGEAETVTVSARRGDLTGATRDANIAAVQMGKGETEVSATFRTELKIMAEIIDGSLQAAPDDDVWVAYTDGVRYFGDDSSYQYVPGYGVLFRKTARLNLATRVIQGVAPSRLEPGGRVQSLRQRLEESTDDQRQAYAEHLAALKQSTAEILATYGPTLTGMSADEWVGIYYDVGPAAGLLEGGISNFLVQARMADIRQAGGQADGASWLAERLVTNERRD